MGPRLLYVWMLMSDIRTVVSGEWSRTEILRQRLPGGVAVSGDAKQIDAANLSAFQSDLDGRVIAVG
jgi:hypothetical protein